MKSAFTLSLLAVLTLSGCSTATPTLQETSEQCGGAEVGLSASGPDSLLFFDGFEGGSEGIKCVFDKVLDGESSAKLSELFDARTESPPTDYGDWTVAMAEESGVFAVAVSRK